MITIISTIISIVQHDSHSRSSLVVSLLTCLVNELMCLPECRRRDRGPRRSRSHFRFFDMVAVSSVSLVSLLLLLTLFVAVVGTDIMSDMIL